VNYHTGYKLPRDITDTTDEHIHAARTPNNQRTQAQAVYFSSDIRNHQKLAP